MEDELHAPAPAVQIISIIRTLAQSQAGAGVFPVRDSVDLFICEAGGLGAVEFRGKFPLKDSIFVSTTEGDKTAVLIANSPLQLNYEALSNLDALEQLRFSFRDDDPQRPLMSAVADFSAGDTVQMSFKPLMCRITIESVTNEMSGYKRLEEPRAFLSCTNPEAELFREQGFCRTSPEVADTLRRYLPYDIGLFPQYPGTDLYCYPNDTPASEANPATVLNLEGECKGERRLMSFPLPPLPRGCHLYVEITFDETESSFSIR